MLTENCKIAHMIGSTMHKVEQISEIYNSLHNEDGKPVIETGFVDVASQSLPAGVSLIKNKLSRYEMSIRSLLINNANRTDESFKNKVFKMAGLLKVVNENLASLSALNIPIHMTDQESCYVGIGYYGTF
jgi:hypothetical protein